MIRPSEEARIKLYERMSPLHVFWRKAFPCFVCQEKIGVCREVIPTQLGLPMFLIFLGFLSVAHPGVYASGFLCLSSL